MTSGPPQPAAREQAVANAVLIGMQALQSERGRLSKVTVEDVANLLAVVNAAATPPTPSREPGLADEVRELLAALDDESSAPSSSDRAPTEVERWWLGHDQRVDRATEVLRAALDRADE